MESRLSGWARGFILAVVAGGAAVVAARIPGALRWDAGDVLAWGGFAAAIIATDRFLIPMRHGTETENFTLTDALWATALLAARPGVLTLAVATAVPLSQGIRRWAPHKIAFNVGQFALSAAAAEAVFAAFGTRHVEDPVSWLAAAAAMAASFAVNNSALALVIALVERVRFLEVLLPPLGVDALVWAGNMAIGILGAFVLATTSFGVALLVAPVVLSYLAYRDRLRGLQERDRMRALYESSRALMSPIGEAADFGSFLSSVASLLEADRVEAAVIDGSTVTVHGSDGAVETLPLPVGDGGPAEMLALARSWMSTNMAPVAGPEGALGALAVLRGGPLSATERAALDALASQLYVKLENRRLFSETASQREELEEIFAHSSDGIFVVAPDRTILTWNPAMERITGYAAAEAVGRRCEEILWPPRQAEAAGVAATDLFELSGSASEADAVDAQIVTRDGNARWIRYTYTPVRGPDGVLKSDVVVARDVTAEREADQLKADFVATVSHELRTPLTPLKGFLATLLQETIDDSREARREYYRIMMNQADRLERLITDLLEVSSIESGAPVVTPQLLELTALVSDQIEEFSRQQPERRIRFHSPGIPVPVRADPFRVQQVVGNLVSNALKYSPPDARVDVAVRIAGEEAVVSVRDEGEGIPTAEQTRVFDRFHRVENGLTRRTGGTGLGLYIAKRLVEAMSGRLWLDSAPGHGSTFSFTLPIDHRVEPAEPRAQQEAATGTSAGGASGARGA